MTLATQVANGRALPIDVMKQIVTKTKPALRGGTDKGCPRSGHSGRIQLLADTIGQVLATTASAEPVLLGSAMRVQWPRGTILTSSRRCRPCRQSAHSIGPTRPRLRCTRGDLEHSRCCNKRQDPSGWANTDGNRLSPDWAEKVRSASSSDRAHLAPLRLCVLGTIRP